MDVKNARGARGLQGLPRYLSDESSTIIQASVVGVRRQKAKSCVAEFPGWTKSAITFPVSDYKFAG